MKKTNPVSSEDEPEQPTPTLTIISPTSETTVERTIDSIFLTAVIGNSDYIDSIEINGEKVSVLELGGDTLSLRLKLEGDTAKFVVAVYYQTSKSLLDSIIVFREVPQVTRGMAKISGTLLQESSGPLAKKLAKARIALNAQGVKAEVEKVIPVSGADIMVYDAEALSTYSDTIVKTDSAGKWSVEIVPGNYFVFAVYFDRENLEIVSTALPDIEAEKDKETMTDTAIAISDDINPMLMTFLDAAEANNNIFIGSDIPIGLPIIMSFSEPMTRASVGDSLHGVVLGKVDADSSELPLIDTIPVRKLWGPNGKELRLVPQKALAAGETYKVVIPSNVKDLALNKLDADYTGIFEVTEAVSMPPFAIKTTAPADGDTISTGFPVECIFTRPLDVLSLNKQYTLTSADDSTMQGFFEVKGNVARFVNKKPWLSGVGYTLKVNSGVKDLLGDSLGKAVTVSFRIQQKDAFEQKEGIEGMVASTVKRFLGAYIAGDIENFAQSFHSNFELIETTPDGQTLHLQLSAFLEKMRSDIEERNRLAKYGIIAPVFYYPVVDGRRHVAWRLVKGSTAVYFEDMGPDGGIGRVPRVITPDNKDITDSVRFVNRGIVYNGETLYFVPDMGKAFIDGNARENDPTIFGKLLVNSTNVETQEIMLEIKEDFLIRNLTAQEGNDTAQVMIELITEERYLDGKRPFPVADPDNPPPDVEKMVTALQTKLVFTSGKWMVLQIAAKELYAGDKQEFKQEAIADTAFEIQNFEQTRPIEFVSPKQKSVAVATPIKFEWSVPKTDNIGGYLVVISNELNGGNQGLIIFTRKTTLTISEKGAVDSGAVVLSVDPKTLTAPIPRFSARLTSFTVNDSDVYIWKVMGIIDTSSSSIQPGAPVNIIADSDFGSHGGIGIFTLMGEMPDIAITLTQFDPGAQLPDDRFSDRDGDMFPDWIEKAFATSPDDPGSYPNFTLDTDLDGFPDFLEQFAGSNPEDAESKPEDTDPVDNIPDMLQQRPEWRPELNMDDDKDGFPNEVEMLFGTDPWNPDSKPSKSIKASVPVNTYFGGIKIGDQEWKRINFSLISDTTGNFAYIDTTELQGIARGGVDLTVRLFWNNGEWVFYLGLVNGPNTGKFIKVRFHRDGNNLCGPVDLADIENGGGPCIGEFFASIDSIKDFSNISGTSTGPIVNPDEQGPLNLGPPPMDCMKRPDSGSMDMTLVLSFTENGEPGVKAYINNDTVAFERPFWSPGQFPSLGCSAPQSSKQYRLEGSLYRIAEPASTADTLVLMGIIEFNKEDESGGVFRENFDYIVFITGISDPKRPAGTWTGWYTKPVGPVNQGPNPFIGTKDSVDAALERTGNKGIVLETQQIVSITSVAQEGNVWTAEADTSIYFIMEKMGDFISVMFKIIDDKQYIVLAGRGQGTGPMMLMFAGDSTAIVEALTASSNQVKVAAPNPFVITVDPATLRREQPQGVPEAQWVVAESGKPSHLVAFASVDNDPKALRIEENKPVVIDIMMGTRPDKMPFQGDSSLIVSALEGSGNMVWPADAPNPASIEVDPASLMRMQNPDNPDEFGYIVSAAGATTGEFIFMGEEQNPQVLLMNGNMPMVFKK
ncbi:MAG: Ig-like domain-containing protein [Chitinispirillaceae bacterium]|nr:Ig-like domain-containing protein [Chitinispirillaceae bacterium]